VHDDDGALSFLLYNCAAMFVGAFSVGMLPLMMDLGEGRLKVLSIFSAGLMVGTALAVIIPEGAESFYDMRQHGEEGAENIPNAIVGGALVGGFLVMLVLESINWGGTAAHGHGHGGHKRDGEDKFLSGGGGHARGEYGLVEVICGRKHDEAGGHDNPGADLPMWRLEGFQTLVGILVHSFADGAAVGVAALSPNRGLGMLVAVAIIMHKAPAAFGLCTYLLNTRWDLGRTRRAMAIFSLASPLSALLVYLTISSLPMLNQPLSVPLCLLLSGGTFLYAACIHVLPETVGPGGRLTTGQVVAVVVGALIPFGLSLGHAHSHGGGDGVAAARHESHKHGHRGM